jgi:protein-disulfide isomerase
VRAHLAVTIKGITLLSALLPLALACNKQPAPASAAAQPASTSAPASAPASTPPSAPQTPAVQVPPVSPAQAVEAIRPPKGAKVAIVVFEDLQCPSCAYAHPQEQQVARQFGVPLVVHDFPLSIHPWAMQAAVMANYFSGKSRELGQQFRDYIFTHQEAISAPFDADPQNPAGAEQSRQNFQRYAQQFAKQHNVQLPFALDPDNAIARKIAEDQALGHTVNVPHTPTILVTTAGMTKIPPETPVQQLAQAVQQALNQ